LWSDDHAVKESGLGNVGDAPVNDDAGVENLVAFLGLLLTAENPTQRRQVQQIAFVGADDQAYVGHQQHHQDLKKAPGVLAQRAVADDQGKQVGATNAEEAPDGRTDESFQAHPPQLPLEQNDSGADQRAHAPIQIARQSERLQDEAGDRYHDDKKKANKNNIHGKPPADEALPTRACYTRASSAPPRAGKGLPHARRV